MKYTVDFANLFIVIERIANGETLEPKYHLHQLAGSMKAVLSVILNLIGHWFIKSTKVNLF